MRATDAPRTISRRAVITPFVLSAIVGVGCSSAPSEDTEAVRVGEALAGSRPPAVELLDACSALPKLKRAPRDPMTHELLPYQPALDCYRRVQGYEVRVPNHVTTCPDLPVAALGANWSPTSSVPGSSAGLATPPWDPPASAHPAMPPWRRGRRRAAAKYCRYEYAGITRPSPWGPLTLYPDGDGLDEATDRALAGSICSGFAAASTPYSGVRYLVPPMPQTVLVCDPDQRRDGRPRARRRCRSVSLCPGPAGRPGCDTCMDGGT